MLQERIDYFTHMFGLLQDTNSRIEKELIVKDIPDNYKEDFDFIIECLAGKHKFGYTYHYMAPWLDTPIKYFTIKGALQFLLTPLKEHNLSQDNVSVYITCTSIWADFFEPIVNRTLKLGIGNSLIEKEKYAPMLAKKLENDVKFSKSGYFVTEKLDGNRCIASYDGERWNFTSRNGKAMHVDIDMSLMDKSYVYDGEIMTPAQTINSELRGREILFGAKETNWQKEDFNTTSGLINRHTLDKCLVFNVFDILVDAPYIERRHELDKLSPEDTSLDVRILPALGHFATKEDLFANIPALLDKITSTGGEGLMINLADSTYLQKRTDQLLKVKKVYTMDMRVIDIEYGTGKYEGQVGSIRCIATSEYGKEIECWVGTGLSDEQRLDWAVHNEHIIGKIVEVSYFSLSQDKAKRGSKEYSLRFPRLKSVRTDKNTTSEY